MYRRGCDKSHGADTVRRRLPLAVIDGQKKNATNGLGSPTRYASGCQEPPVAFFF
jgi:hypothetical protein